MQRTLFIIALLATSLACLRAGEQTTKHRLIGLSAAERISDLHKTMQEVPDIKLVSLDTADAEITLSYDLQNLFPALNPKKPAPTAEEIEKRLNDVIGAACSRTFSVRPLSVVPKDKLARIDIAIGVLDCKACRYAAYSSVSTLDGVERAAVDMKTHVLTAWVDPAKTKREDLEAALKKARVELKP
jgi:hypothetical protein